MLSNKEYYAPVLDDGEMFEETKDKFDASTTNQNPQEAHTSDEPQASNDEAAGKDCMTSAWLLVVSPIRWSAANVTLSTGVSAVMGDADNAIAYL